MTIDSNAVRLGRMGFDTFFQNDDSIGVRSGGRLGDGGEKLVGHNKNTGCKTGPPFRCAVETEKTMITSPLLHALRSVVNIPDSGKATTLLYVVNANMLFSIIPPPQSP